MSKSKAPREELNQSQVSEILSASVLREMVNSLEETKLKLLLNIKELKEQLAQQKEDQSDIYYYLNKKCDESFEVIASLEEQVLSEQADREIAEKLHECKFEEFRAATALNEAKFMAKIADLENKLELLNNFSEMKDETERTMKTLVTTLEMERSQYSLNTENMENRFLLEREKLRKSYDIKYENVKKELEASIDGKLSKKTQKTQVMNVIMKKELDNQSKHAEKLLEINQTVLEKNKELKLELELTKSMQEEMTSRLTMYQRLIKQSNEQIQRHDEAVSKLHSEHAAAMQTKSEELIRMEAKLNMLQKKVSRENLKMDDMWQFIAKSYQLMKHKPLHHVASSGTLSAGDCNGIPPHSEAISEQHEKLLVNLVKEVVCKYPRIIHHGADEAAAEGDAYSHPSLDKELSQQTGIPTWDFKSDEKSLRTLRSKSKAIRSIGIQTDGQVSPYPLGSSWLANSAADVRSHALLIGSNLGPIGGGSNLWAHRHQTENASFYSSPSMVIGDDPNDLHSISQLSNVTGERSSLSMKSANHVMEPTRQQILAKMRNLTLSNHHKKPAKLQPSKPLDDKALVAGEYRAKYLKQPVSPPSVSSASSVQSNTAMSLPRSQYEMHVEGQGFVSPLVLPRL